ncbi:MAG: hypothetical protein GY801_15335, partial [bacterium]|nr:hypothetical protein [bacterium]
KQADYYNPYPFRKYVRSWVKCDYGKTVKNASPSLDSTDGILNGDVRTTYYEAMGREDVEDFEHPTKTSRLPTNGMQIHAEYTLYGHFFLLK